MSNNLGQKEIAPNGGQYQPKYKSHINDYGELIITKGIHSISVSYSAESNELTPNSYLVAQFFIEKINRKLSWWARKNIEQTIERHIFKYKQIKLNELDPNLPRLIKAYHCQYGLKKDNSNFYAYFKPILSNKYLVEDYCRFPLYRVLYHYFIGRINHQYKYRDIGNGFLVEQIGSSPNWIQNIIDTYKCPIIKKLLTKRYWNNDSVSCLHYLKNYRKIPQTKKELICYNYLSVYYPRFKDWPDIKRINKCIPSLKRLRKTREIKASLSHTLFDPAHHLQGYEGMSNWSWEKLCRESENYHANLAAGRNKNQTRFPDETSWSNSTIIELCDPKIKITPLLTAKDLRDESVKMKHCVGGDNYIESCLRGDSRIYHIEDDKEKATLELSFNPHSSDITNYLYIRQIHGPCNQTNKLCTKFKDLWEEQKIKIAFKIGAPDLIINKKEETLLCANHC